jgi:hypothetical protein
MPNVSSQVAWRVGAHQDDAVLVGDLSVHEQVRIGRVLDHPKIGEGAHGELAVKDRLVELHGRTP